MVTIKVNFKRIQDVSFTEVIDSMGVYVLWGSLHKQKPTYIGQGDILKRIWDHVNKKGEWCGERRIAKPVNGYIAILGAGDKEKKQKKKLSVLLEALLFLVANDINLPPKKNRQNGSRIEIQKILLKHRSIKASIKGYDPFISPNGSRQIKSAKNIRVMSGENGLVISHSWYSRQI